jgi:hypothetical protein
MPLSNRCPDMTPVHHGIQKGNTYASVAVELLKALKGGKEHMSSQIQLQK